MEYPIFKTVCFTGHRHIPAQDRDDLRLSLYLETERQIQAGARRFRAGGALGFDTLAAQVVLELRDKYPSIELELILPCPTQTEGWSQRDAEIYRSILSRADKFCYVSPYYYQGLLQLRNRRLVEGADICIAYLRNSHGGGTAYTSALALRNGLEFINLADRVGWEDGR